MDGFVGSNDCREVILIGETAIYNRIKRFLRSKEGKYRVSLFKSDNVHKTVLCEQKQNKAESYTASIFEELLNLTEPVLVINCGCYYIYPGELIQKDNLTLINFHNGLLPEYRGLNIPSWVIYNAEREGGVTWHRIRERIDAGEIIKKGTVPVGKDENAYQLCRRLFSLGYDLFLEFWHEWEEGRLRQIYTEGSSGKERYYYGKDIPNNGIIDLCNDKAETIYNTLRALDYGKIRQFPPAVLMDKEKRYFVNRYWKGNNSEFVKERRGKLFRLEFDDTFLYIETVEE